MDTRLLNTLLTEGRNSDTPIQGFGDIHNAIQKYMNPDKYSIWLKAIDENKEERYNQEQQIYKARFLATLGPKTFISKKEQVYTVYWKYAYETLVARGAKGLLTPKEDNPEYVRLAMDILLPPFSGPARIAKKWDNLDAEMLTIALDYAMQSDFPLLTEYVLETYMVPHSTLQEKFYPAIEDKKWKVCETIIEFYIDISNLHRKKYNENRKNAPRHNFYRSSTDASRIIFRSDAIALYINSKYGLLSVYREKTKGEYDLVDQYATLKDFSKLQHDLEAGSISLKEAEVSSGLLLKYIVSTDMLDLNNEEVTPTLQYLIRNGASITYKRGDYMLRVIKIGGLDVLKVITSGRLSMYLLDADRAMNMVKGVISHIKHNMYSFKSIIDYLAVNDVREHKEESIAYNYLLDHLTDDRKEYVIQKLFTNM